MLIPGLKIRGVRLLYYWQWGWFIKACIARCMWWPLSNHGVLHNTSSFSEQQLIISKYLIEQHQVDSNCKDKDGNTPLQWACKWVEFKQHIRGFPFITVMPPFCDYTSDFTIYMYLFRLGDLSFARYLIDKHKVDPNSKDTEGKTPLLWACKWEHLSSYIHANSKLSDSDDYYLIDGETLSLQKNWLKNTRLTQTAVMIVVWLHCTGHVCMRGKWWLAPTM